MMRTNPCRVDNQIKKRTIITREVWSYRIIKIIFIKVGSFFINTINLRFNNHQKIILENLLALYLHRLKNDISVWLINLWQPSQSAASLCTQYWGTSVTSKRIINLITIKPNIESISTWLHKIHRRITKMPIIYMPHVTEHPFAENCNILPKQIIFHTIAP